MGLKGLEILPFIGKWRDELGKQGKDLDVGKILKLAHTTAIESNTIEMNYKCLARWYITPNKAHKSQKEVSQFCWRGCKAL